VVDASCDGGRVSVRRTHVDAPDDPWVVDTAIACPGDGAALPVVPIAGGDVLLSIDGELFALSGQDLRPLGLRHAPWNGAGHEPFMSAPIAASRDGTVLAVSMRVDHGARVGTVTMLRYPTLERIADELPATWTDAYARTYTGGFHGMPLAWSVDGALLVLSGEEGALTVRRACDGDVVARAPALPIGDSRLGLTNLAFTPDGLRLISKWLPHDDSSNLDDGKVVVYDVVRH
jgi:hypothetical protein